MACTDATPASNGASPQVAAVEDAGTMVQSDAEPSAPSRSTAIAVPVPSLSFSMPPADDTHGCFAFESEAQGVGEEPPVEGDAGLGGADGGAELPSEEPEPTQAPSSDGRPQAPELLSESGCFTDIETLSLAPELVPYAVVSPLFTDGAHKDRYFTIPEGTEIVVRDDGSWTWPVGTVLFKMFSLDFEGEDGVQRRPVETRVMRLYEGNIWRYYSYRWNDTGTEATLLDGSKDVLYETFYEGEPVDLVYHYPSETTCQACHGFDEVGVAGPTPVQMNMEVEFNGTLQNQLEFFADLGLLSESPEAVPEMPDPADETAPLQDRARAYLHANCAHCHRPDGYKPPEVRMDLRFDTAFQDADICDVPTEYNFGSSLVRLVPGHPEESDLYRRFTSDGVDRMPLAAGQFHDPLGGQLIHDWIESLEGCPE